MSENIKNYIFVSAMPSDGAITMPHISELRSRGYNLVISAPSGVFAASKLRNTIRRAAAVVAFLTLSPSAKERRQFTKELKAAIKYKVPIIPVNIGFDADNVPDVLKKTKTAAAPVDGHNPPYYAVTDIEARLSGICAPSRPSAFHDAGIITEDEKALSAEALFAKGRQAEQRGMAAKAACYFSLSSEKGHAAASRELGYCYEFGRGVSLDYAKAIDCLKTAVAQGDIQAYVNLGNLYLDGQGVPADLKKALQYYEEGAAKGNGEALNNAGRCYLFGYGTKVDEAKAMNYYHLAADSGIPESQYLLGFIYERGKYGLPQDYEKSFEYYSLAAAQGFEKAYGNVGICYSEGMGTEQNDELAAKYLELSANSGDSYGQYNFGFCLYRGKGVPEDKERALHYIAMAAKQKHPKALEDLKKLGRTDLLKNC